MFNPPHPASILKHDIIPALQISVSQAAKELGVTRITLSRLLNEHSGISPEMALRLENWLGTDNGGSAASWMQMQLHYDISKARIKFNEIKTSVSKASIKKYSDSE